MFVLTIAMGIETLHPIVGFGFSAGLITTGGGVFCFGGGAWLYAGDCAALKLYFGGLPRRFFSTLLAF